MNPLNNSMNRRYNKEFFKIKIYQSYQNAKVGEDTHYNIWPNVTGSFAIGKTNSRCEKLLEFAENINQLMQILCTNINIQEEQYYIHQMG